MDQGKKTGRFLVRTELQPGFSEEEGDYVRRRMWRELAEPIIFAMRDGRVYSVMYSGIEHEDEGSFGPRHVFEFSILLYVTHAREASVGEWVWDIPVRVPDNVGQWRAPWGAVFERGGIGWRRVK